MCNCICRFTINICFGRLIYRFERMLSFLLWFDCRIMYTESAVYQLVCCVIWTFEWTQNNMWAFFNEYPFVYCCEIKRFIKMIDFICLKIFNHSPTVTGIHFKQNIMLFKQFFKNLFVRYFPIVYFRPCQTDVRWEISYHPFTYHKPTQNHHFTFYFLSSSIFIILHV